MEVNFNVNEPKITKEFLLDKHSQETYMEYYLGIPVKKGLFCSPLREDKTPTCSFYRNKLGDLIFKDFSGQFYGNFISVVMYKYGITYYMALQMIANDFGYINRPKLTKNPKPVEESKTVFKDQGPSKIRVEIQQFTDEELQWWGQYGITEDVLKHFQVYSCKSVFLNGDYFTGSTRSQRIYGYYRGKDADNVELWRIYFPGRQSFKFLSNWKAIMLQGAKQLPKEGDFLVITKSMKDVMCLYSMGITAIAPNSENLFVTENQWEKLKARFKNIVLFYDNDLPGISNMNKIRKKFDIKCLWIPRKCEAKDISDFYSKYGRDKTLQLINEAKERIK